MKSPSGFMLEAGWAGRLIDDATWKPKELYGPSIWGHERNWLPAEARQAARKLVDDAAARGILEPTQTNDSPAFSYWENPDAT